jgi:hypothetical protein
MRTIVAILAAILGLWFLAGGVLALVRLGWQGALGALLMAFVGIVTLRVAGFLLQPAADDSEKLS